MLALFTLACASEVAPLYGREKLQALAISPMPASGGFAIIRRGSGAPRSAEEQIAAEMISRGLRPATSVEHADVLVIYRFYEKLLFPGTGHFSGFESGSVGTNVERELVLQLEVQVAVLDETRTAQAAWSAAATVGANTGATEHHLLTLVPVMFTYFGRTVDPAIVLPRDR